MNKEEIEIWTAFNKFKSTDKKIVEAVKLKDAGSAESLDLLCEEFLNNRSPVFRDDLLKIIEYLELKLQPERKELAKYNLVLEKYKIANVQNFWFNDHKEVSIETLEEDIQSFVDKVINKKENKLAKYDCKYPITTNLKGIVQLSIVPKSSSYDIQQLTVGFYSNYRDIGGGYINKSPYDQHHFRNNDISLFNLTRNRLPDYVSFLQNLENELLMVDVENPIQSKYYKSFCKHISFNKELWFILSLINIQIKNNQFDKMKRTAQIGIDIQGGKKAGSGWLSYYREKISADSSNR